MAVPCVWLLGLACCVFVCVGHSENPLVLLVSFDGFRWDYLDKAKQAGKLTPNFDSLIADGVMAKWIKNTFVTKTFPNHYTIVTGYYEESHGVVGNEMYDPVFNEVFQMTDTDSKWWNNGTDQGGPEPIWITNQLAPQTVLYKRRSGIMMWPGSEALSIHGTRPYHYTPYNRSITNETRIETVVNWLSSEEDPINLGLLYFSEPDHLGHQVGPDAPQMMDMIEALDGVVGQLVDKLKQKKLFHNINLVITSDHGMAKYDQVIDLSKYIDTSLYRKFGHAPVFNILPNEGKEQEVYDTLRKVPNLEVSWKTDIPREYHYTYNRRIMPIVVSAHVGYSLSNGDDNYTNSGGTHGYNNSEPSMHPFFIAHGPAFKKGYVSEPFNNVDIYPLLCKLLDITPYPNNGSLQVARDLLGGHFWVDGTLMGSLLSYTMLTYILVAMFAGCISGLFCIAACRTQRIVMRRRRTVHVSLAHISKNSYPADGHTHLLAQSEEDEEEIP